MQTKHVAMASLAMLAATAAAYAGPSGGTISGKVTYEGTSAKMKAIDMSVEPSCAKMYATPPLAETLVTGAGNSLENVVVYVSAGAPNDAAPSTAAIFTQKGCRYIPHLLALQVNQELKITNEDQTVHNVHPQPKRNREWNKSQPPGAPPISESYEQGGIHPREVQRASLDAWHLGGDAQLALRRDRRGRFVLVAQPASGQVHHHRLARVLRRAVPGSHHHRQRDPHHQLRLQVQPQLNTARSLCHSTFTRRELQSRDEDGEVSGPQTHPPKTRGGAPKVNFPFTVRAALVESVYF